MNNTLLLHVLDADQRRTVENVRAAAQRIWSRPLHRYYTDHTVAHSERVIALLDGLTAGMMTTPKRLAPTEVLVLLAAAYLHDIGMQDERHANGDLEAIRAAHHEVTAELIYRAAEDPAQAVHLGLPDDPGLVEAVALVAKGHRKVDLLAAEYDPLVHGGATLRLRLLAALLRFGDELDMDHRRVDLEQMKLLNLPVESQLHWWKCHYVSGVSIVDEYIHIAYRFPQSRPDYEGLIVPLVESEVRAKHAALEPIFRADAVKAALGPAQVRLMRAMQALPAEVEELAREQRSRGAGEQRRAGESPRPRVSASPTPPVTVSDQRPVSGAQYHIHIEHAEGLAIGDGAQVVTASGQPGPAPSPAASARSAPPAGLPVLRRWLNQQFDDVGLDAFCLDHFLEVYDTFGRGMRKDEKITLLLDYCRREPGRWEALLAALKNQPA